MKQGRFPCVGGTEEGPGLDGAQRRSGSVEMRAGTRAKLLQNFRDSRKELGSFLQGVRISFPGSF